MRVNRYVVVGLSGLAHGGINALEPTIVSEMFGLKNMGEGTTAVFQLNTLACLRFDVPSPILARAFENLLCSRSRSLQGKTTCCCGSGNSAQSSCLFN
jgi:hypothetical protein